MDEKEEKGSFYKLIMKNLLPSLRESNRYIGFEITSNKQLNEMEARKGLEKEIMGFLGSLELAKSSFKLINFHKNKGIIKVDRKYLNKMKAVLSLIKEIENNKVMVKSLTVSGILKKVKSRL